MAFEIRGEPFFSPEWDRSHQPGVGAKRRPPITFEKNSILKGSEKEALRSLQDRRMALVFGGSALRSDTPANSWEPSGFQEFSIYSFRGCRAYCGMNLLCRGYSLPAPKNPDLPEYFVYRLEVAGVPFYVGVGRSSRASDRFRYVRSLMAREASGKPVKWNMSCEVVAGLLRAGCEPSVAYPVQGVVRAAAAAQEVAEITRLATGGTVLANIYHNPRPPSSAAVVVQAVLDRVAAHKPNQALPRIGSLGSM